MLVFIDTKTCFHSHLLQSAAQKVIKEKVNTPNEKTNLLWATVVAHLCSSKLSEITEGKRNLMEEPGSLSPVMISGWLIDSPERSRLDRFIFSRGASCPVLDDAGEMFKARLLNTDRGIIEPRITERNKSWVRKKKRTFKATFSRYTGEHLYTRY